MKRLLSTLVVITSATSLLAQGLTVKTPSVAYVFDAAQTGEMTYQNGGSELTIQGKTFPVADILSMTVGAATMADNTVAVDYSGASAQVTIAGNVARHLSVDVSGAHVRLVQDDQVTDEITYTLSGMSADGSFTMDGELKATVVLNGLTLTSGRGAPINIENGKRIDIVVADGTVNTFSDYASGAQKACFFVNGHPEFSGSGTVNLTGNARHAFRSDEYTKLKKSFTGTINVLRAVSDGLHVEQYLEMNGGNVVIDHVGGDAIDVAMTNDPTDIHNGSVFIRGGSITATTSAADVKTLKSDSAVTVSGGTLYLKATGDGSKALSSKQTLLVTGGRIEALSLGGVYMEDDPLLEAKPNAVKADGVITISGGVFYAVSNNKAFNTDVTTRGFLIDGGSVMGISPKANASVSGSQPSKTYTKVQVKAGATVSYNGLSYTVPSTYSCSSAYVLVSPYQ